MGRVQDAFIFEETSVFGNASLSFTESSGIKLIEMVDHEVLSTMFCHLQNLQDLYGYCHHATSGTFDPILSNVQQSSRIACCVVSLTASGLNSINSPILDK